MTHGDISTIRVLKEWLTTSTMALVNKPNNVANSFNQIR